MARPVSVKIYKLELTSLDWGERMEGRETYANVGTMFFSPCIKRSSGLETMQARTILSAFMYVANSNYFLVQKTNFPSKWPIIAGLTNLLTRYWHGPFYWWQVSVTGSLILVEDVLKTFIKENNAGGREAIFRSTWKWEFAFKFCIAMRTLVCLLMHNTVPFSLPYLHKA